MNVGPCMRAAAGSSDQKAWNTLRRATVAASAIVPPVSALDRQMMSGTMPAWSQAKSEPVRPKPVMISSEDQQAAMARRQRGDRSQRVGAVEFHAAGALHQRFDDDGGEAAALLGQQRVERRERQLVPGQIGYQLRRHVPGQNPMHALFGIADRHGAERVAVIAVAERQEAVAPGFAAVQPILHCHLHRGLRPRPNRIR